MRKKPSSAVQGQCGYKRLGACYGGCPATAVRGVFAGYDLGGAYVGVGGRL